MPTLVAKGSYFALVRADGRFLARYPVLDSRLVKIDDRSELSVRIARGLDRSTYTADSPIDHIGRRIGYRKLSGFPLYVLAGVEKRAIISEWLRYNSSYLIFGLPLTVVPFCRSRVGVAAYPASL